MVDINGKSYSDIIKIKGTDKKIDLTKLEGLHRTEQNKAIFDMVDKNKDGVIDTKEAKILQNNLLTGSNGDGKISEKEANKHYGKESNAFDAISALADQQKAFDEGKEYIETDGNKSTHYNAGGFYTTIADGEFVTEVTKGLSYTKETSEDGTVTITTDDGTQEIQYKDGTKQLILPDGTVKSFAQNGKHTSTIQNGNITTYPDDNTTITKNPDGQVIQTKTSKDGVIIRTDFEYQDGKTIERQYSEDSENTQLTGITVKEKKDGHNIDTKFATEEDMTNNRPSEIVTDAHNPTQKTVTKFTYNEDGTYSTETTDSAGNKTVKNFNKDGTEIVEKPKPEVPTTHTVKKGESITQIVKDALAQQGIENPTPEQLKEAKKEFLELNKDLVKTYKGVKKEWHGNKFFYPDDVVKLPNFVKEDSISPDNTAVKDNTVVKDNTAVDNNTVVKDNTAVENNTVVDNNTEVVENQLTEDELAMVNEFDEDNSNTINKEEFTTLINEQLANLPPSTVEVNKEQIQTLIDEAFAKVDAQNKDSELSQAELKQNLNTAIEELAEKINNLEEQAVVAQTGADDQSQTLSITDGSNYDLQSDETYLAINEQIEELERRKNEIEEQYGISPNDKFGVSNLPSNKISEYWQIEHELKSLPNIKERYEQQMESWVDGSTSRITINGFSFQAKKVTLSNGQRALEINGKYYALENNGWIPDFSKEIILSE